MQQDKLDSYKHKLEQEREKLLAQIQKTEKIKEFGNDVEDNTEEAAEAEEFANNLAVGGVYRERLTEIDSALSKIADGSYGICEGCSREISEKEMTLVPETDLCEECKKN